VAENTPVPLNRTERILAFMIAAVGGLSVLSIIAIIITGFAHVDTTSGVWLTVKLLPAIGLPIALILIIVFGVLSGVRRRRLNNGGN
jgi:formate/nitrite transporter FocA (FNT family)